MNDNRSNTKFCIWISCNNEQLFWNTLEFARMTVKDKKNMLYDIFILDKKFENCRKRKLLKGS